jgi:CRISPR-associated endonuclease/helicase Cas3
VGADLDFDAMVTECASLSALLQRAGRLNRAGELPCAPLDIVHAKSAKEADPVYGEDLKNAWAWQKQRAGKSGTVDLSPVALRETSLPAETEADYPLLGESDLNLLAQTTTRWDIDLAPWLHGFGVKSEATVLWRADFPDDAHDWERYLRCVPPVGGETLTIPAWELRDWLRSRHEHEPVALWNGDQCQVRKGGEIQVHAGALVVVPSRYGGCDAWGWAPDSAEPVSDLGDGETRVRIHPALRDGAAEWLAAYAEEDSSLDDRELLALAGVVPDRPWRVLDYPGGVVVLFGAPAPEQVFGVEVDLDEHSRGVARYAGSFAPESLPGEVREAVRKAALWHDVGKADERFQLALGAAPSDKLAKSRARSRSEARLAWSLSGLPAGWRHEIASAASLAGDDELIRYLVATHHGRGRCWLPAQPDAECWENAGGANWPDLHARLSERFGRWGLAYLETLVRLADWAKSRAEAEQGA